MNPALPKSWYYVYLLKSKLTKWIYIGCTNNIRKRIQEHIEGKVFSTKKMIPIELVYYEAYRSKNIAYNREKMLKHYGSSLVRLLIRIGIRKKGRAG
jgi:putative endonuclease